MFHTTIVISTTSRVSCLIRSTHELSCFTIDLLLHCAALKDSFIEESEAEVIQEREISAPQTLLKRLQRKKKIKDNVKVSKGDDNLVKSGEKWLMKYFSRSATILPINKIKNETGLACIMDSPEVHMAFEYIEDTYLKEAMDLLSDVFM